MSSANNHTTNTTAQGFEALKNESVETWLMKQRLNLTAESLVRMKNSLGLPSNVPYSNVSDKAPDTYQSDRDKSVPFDSSPTTDINNIIHNASSTVRGMDLFGAHLEPVPAYNGARDHNAENVLNPAFDASAGVNLLKEPDNVVLDSGYYDALSSAANTGLEDAPDATADGVPAELQTPLEEALARVQAAYDKDNFGLAA